MKPALILTLALTLGCIGTNAQAQPKIDVTYCKAQWSMSPDTLYIDGCISAHFKPMHETISSIDFDLADKLTVDSVTSHHNKLSFSHSGERLAISLPNSLEPEQTDSISIFYHGEPASTGYGSFKIDKRHKTLWTLSEPFGSKDWWPSRQNKYDKIDSMDIFVKCPIEYEVATNGIMKSDIRDGGSHVVHYRESHPINYYMVGVAIGAYDMHKSKLLLKNDMTMDLVDYSWPETSYPGYNAEYTEELLNLYGECLIPYPYADEKYGHAQIGWNGGIEHQTMTFIYGFEPVTIAHELAHQWFGNYVTCEGWQNIWINEGFASYLEYLAIQKCYASDTTEWKKYKLNGALRSRGPIYVADTNDINVIFSQATTYDKGAMALAMLRNEIGTSAFFKGCRAILDKYGNGFASVDDARRCFEDAADTSLVQFFDNWIYGEGYPVYTVTYKSKEDGKLKISVGQSSSKADGSFFPMHITLRITGQNAQRDIRLYNTKPQEDFEVPVDFDVKEVIFDPYIDILCKSTVSKEH